MATRDTQPSNAQPRTSPEKPKDTTEGGALKGEKQAGAKKKWDIIDENAWESFPASDAPASWAGRDLTPEEREAMSKQHKKTES